MKHKDNLKLVTWLLSELYDIMFNYFTNELYLITNFGIRNVFENFV